MTEIDTTLLVGYLISAWSIGFAGGLTLSTFRNALSDLSRG